VRHLPRAPPARRRRVCSALRVNFSAPFLSAEGEDCPAFCGRFAAVCKTAENGLFRASETLQSGRDGCIGALLACGGPSRRGQSARKGQSGRKRAVKKLFVRYAGNRMQRHSCQWPREWWKPANQVLVDLRMKLSGL